MKDTRMVRGFVLSAVLALFSFGCSNPCDDVQEQCDACNGTDTISVALKDACNQTVALDDSDVCDAALDSNVYASCP